MVLVTLSGRHESSGGAEISSGVIAHGPSDGASVGPGDGGGVAEQGVTGIVTNDRL